MPKPNKEFIFIALLAVVLIAGYYFIKNANRPEPVMNVTYSSGPKRTEVTRAVSGTVGPSGSNIEDIYAKTELRFTNKKVALSRPPAEIVTELHHMGLTREELLVSVADLLTAVDDDLKAKNMTTSYITSLGFPLSGGEYLSLLQAADVADDFYYSNLIKATVENARFPLSNRQKEWLCAPLEDVSYRIKCENMLAREAQRQAQ